MDDPSCKGCLVTVHCGEEDVYQGKVEKYVPSTKSITLERPFKDGLPTGLPFITLESSIITELKVVKMPESPPERVAVTRIVTRAPEKMPTGESPPKKQKTCQPAVAQKSAGSKLPQQLRQSTSAIPSMNCIISVPKVKKTKQSGTIENLGDTIGKMSISKPPPPTVPSTQQQHRHFPFFFQTPQQPNQSQPQQQQSQMKILSGSVCGDFRYFNEPPPPIATVVQPRTPGGFGTSRVSLVSSSSSRNNQTATWVESIKTPAVHQSNGNIGKQPPPARVKPRVITNKNIGKKAGEANGDPMNDLYGCMVALDCGAQGFFQGKTVAIDTTNKTITIEKPFKDGILMEDATHTIPSSILKDIKVISMPSKEDKIVPLVGAPAERGTSSSHLAKILKPGFVPISQPAKPKKTAANDSPMKSFNASIQFIPGSVLTNGKHSKKIVEQMQVAQEKATSVPPVTPQPVEGKQITLDDLFIKPSPMQSTATPEIAQAQKNSSIAEIPPFEKYGDFKRFTGQQVAIPQRLEMSTTNNGSGPSGIPTLDCANGYGLKKETGLGEQIDLIDLRQDFDFECSNALFNKGEISDEEHQEGRAEEVHEAFRNDENVIQDPARIIPWTQQSSAIPPPVPDNN